MKKILLICLVVLFSFKVFSEELSDKELDRAFRFGDLVVSGSVAGKTLKEKNNVGIPDTIRVSAVDPFTGYKYKNTLIGNTQTLKWNEFSFGLITHYRYITLYDAKRNPDFRLSGFPAIEEECHDEGWSFGEWTSEYNYSMTLTVGGGIKLPELGLESSVTYAITHGASFRSTRRLQGTKGLRAIHTPYGSTEDWQGVTYIQWYNSQSGEYGILSKSIGDHIESFFGGNSYPWRFYLNNQNFIFKVKRTDEEVCKGYEGKVLLSNPMSHAAILIP